MCYICHMENGCIWLVVVLITDLFSLHLCVCEWVSVSVCAFTICFSLQLQYYKDSNGCTALHYAVTLGHADATVMLLDLGADPNRQDRKGRTPAHCGCAKGQFETVIQNPRRNEKSPVWLSKLENRWKCYEIARQTCGCETRKAIYRYTRRPHPDDVSSCCGY